MELYVICKNGLLSDQEFNSFEDNHQKIILFKTGDKSPSIPISSRKEQTNKFPTLPKVVPDAGLGTGANPAGAGGLIIVSI